MDNIDHEYTDEIVCPYCGEEVSDSWEFTEECGITECGNCYEEFEYVCHVTVTYSTRKVVS